LSSCSNALEQVDIEMGGTLLEDNKAVIPKVGSLKTLQNVNGEEYIDDLNDITEMVREELETTGNTNAKQSGVKPEDKSVLVQNESLVIGEEHSTWNKGQTVKSEWQKPLSSKTKELIEIERGQSEIKTGISLVSTEAPADDSVRLSKTPSTTEKETQLLEKSSISSFKEENLYLQGKQDKFVEIAEVVGEKAEATKNINDKQSEFQPVDDLVRSTSDLRMIGEEEKPLNRDQTVESGERMLSSTNLLEMKKVETGQIERHSVGDNESNGGVSVERTGLSEAPFTMKKGTHLVEKAKLSSSKMKTLDKLQNVKGEERTTVLNDIIEVVSKKTEVTENKNVKFSDVKQTGNSVPVKSVSLMKKEEETTLNKDQIVESEGRKQSCSNQLEVKDIVMGKGTQYAETDRRSTTTVSVEGIGLTKTPSTTEERTQHPEKAERPSLKMKTSEIPNVKDREGRTEFKDIIDVVSEKVDVITNKSINQSEVKHRNNFLSFRLKSSIGDKLRKIPNLLRSG